MTPTPVQSSAPGKVILFGEHAVVHGRPAIAVPVTQVRATVTAKPAPPGSGLTLIASDLGKRIALSTVPQDEPLAAAARFTLIHLSMPEPDVTLNIHSTIPIASGLGSGTAVSTAIVRALASFLDHKLGPAEVSPLVFEVEKIHHGTPSGIDNTVVAYERPVYFARGGGSEPLTVGEPFTLVIGDTGIRSSTRVAVERVRRAWERNRARYDALFNRIGDLVDEGRDAIEAGDVDALGPLMDHNHELLIELGVSSPQLDALVNAARSSGAMGAKLSGGGLGGNMIALGHASPHAGRAQMDDAEQVAQALTEAGAARVIRTTVTATG